MAPLTNLLKAVEKYIWTSQCQAAFDKVKELAAPHLGVPFQLQVDASNVGAVLFQQDGDAVSRPVSYFSRKFKSHQLHYSVVAKGGSGVNLGSPIF